MATQEEKIIISVEVDQQAAERRVTALIKTVADLRKERARLNKALKDGAGNADDNAKALNEVNQALKHAQKEIKLTNRELESGSNSLEQQRVALIRLNQQWDKLSKEQQQNAKVGGVLKNQINDLTDDIKNQEFATQRFGRNVGNYTESIQEAFAGMIPGGELLSGAIAGPAAAIGAAVTVIQKGGEALINLTKRIEAQRKEVQALTDASGSDLDAYTAKIAAISETFNQDFNQVLVATNSLTNQLGGNFTNNADALGKGLALLGDQGSELLEIIREYPALFQDTGLAADQLITIASQQIKDGIYSDKGVDAIKEGLLSIREMPKATKAALDGIGLSGEQIQEGIQSGAMTSFEALQQVSDRISQLDPESKEVGTAIADIFRGAGQDAGVQYLATLKDINLSMDDLVDSSGEFAKQQIELLQVNEQLEYSWNQLLGGSSSFFTEVEIMGKQVVAGVLRAFIRSLEHAITGWRTLKALGPAFFQTLIVVGTQVIDNIQARFSNFFDSIGNAFTALMSGNFSGIREAFSQGADVAAISFTETFKDRFNAQGFEIFRFEDVAVENAAKEAGKQLGKAMAEGTKEGYQSAIGQIAELGVNELADAQVEIITELSNDISGIEAVGLEAVERFREQREKLALEREQRIQGITNAIQDTAAATEEALAPIIAMRDEEIEQSARATFATMEEGEAKERAIQREIAAQKDKDKALKIARGVAKAAAIADLAISLAQQLQSIQVAAAKISGFAPPATIPLGIAYGIAQSAAAVISQRQRISEIRALESGGFSGGGDRMAVTHDGRIVSQRKSYADGGMIARPTLALTGEAGAEYVAPNEQIRRYPQLFDFLNKDRRAFRGNPFGGYSLNIPAFADGGFTARQISGTANDQLRTEASLGLGETLKNMPAPIVTVEDINAGLDRVSEVKSSADV